MARDARPTLHRQTMRLVHHEQVVVAVDDHSLQFPRDVGIDLRGLVPRNWRSRRGKRRYANRLAGGKSGRRIGASAVHTDLAGAAQLLDRPLVQAGEMPTEPAVEANVRFVLGHDA